MLTDRAEEMLEVLWVEIVEHKRQTCDANLLKDSEAIAELIKWGYAEKNKESQFILTHKGMEEARDCIRRHRLAERLFVDIIDVKKKLVHETSCRFEHLLHKGLDENICTLLGHPKTCPHGRPIPEGRCCKDLKKVPSRLIMPLPELETGKKAKVSYLHTQDQQILKKIIAMGVLPNAEITLIQKFPSYVFQIGKSQFAVDRELALCIYVRVV